MRDRFLILGIDEAMPSTSGLWRPARDDYRSCRKFRDGGREPNQFGARTWNAFDFTSTSKPA
jgi:hypothetical protein